MSEHARDGLRHPDPEERRRTAASLEPHEVSAALGELYPLLDDADWRVRREVALALARLPEPERALDPLLDAVERGDVARRNAGIEAVRHIGERAEGAVLARLARAQGSARRFLVEVLGDAGTERAAPVLRGLLDDADPNVPPAAAEVLGRIRGEAASEALRAALAHADPVVRLAALQAFSARGEALAFALLEPLLADPLCRRAALRAAASCDDPRALDAVVDALVRGPASLSGEAALSCALAARLGAGRRAQVQALLRERLGAAGAQLLCALAERASDGEVRSAAVRCLGLLGAREGVGCVLRALEQQETAAAADEALDGFDGAAVPAALEAASGLGTVGVGALLRWAAPAARDEDRGAVVRLALAALERGDAGAPALHAVATLGDEAQARALEPWLRAHGAALEAGAVGPSLEALARRHPALRGDLEALAPARSLLGLYVAEALARAGHPVAVDPLREALGDERSAVRLAAVRALGASAAREARDALELALTDEDPGVQAAAAEALGGGGGGREVLEQLLFAAEPRVRRAAAMAVGRRTDEGVRALLARLLEDPDAGVVLAGVDALGARAREEDLLRLVGHPEADVAADALARLRARGSASAVERARGLLAHAAWSVRLEAARTLDPRDEGDRARLRARLRVERDELVAEALEAALAAGDGDGGPAGA